MVSVQEWGDSCPNKFLGAYKLEYDMSWTPADEMLSKSEPLNKMMSAVTAYTHSQSTSSGDNGGSSGSSAKSILALADSS